MFLRKNILLQVLLACLYFSSVGVAAHTAATEPTSLRFQGEIAKRITDVTEFRVIREILQGMGVRGWLFGGTAAGFAHYVKWDLDRADGDPRYIDSRFDYDFTNIYRSTQGADLVIDGSEDQARTLEQLIKAKVSHLQGSKDDWEIRLLRKDREWGRVRMVISVLQSSDFNKSRCRTLLGG